MIVLLPQGGLRLQLGDFSLDAMEHWREFLHGDA
jgi:hypothetical protein